MNAFSEAVQVALDRIKPVYVGHVADVHRIFAWNFEFTLHSN